MEAKPLLKYGWMRALLFALTFLVLLIAANKLTDELLSGLMPQTPNGSPAVMSGTMLLVKSFVFLVVSVITTYFFRKLIDKKELVTLGFQFKDNLSHALTGFLLALLLLGLGTFLLIAGNNLQWTSFNFDANQFITGIAIMSCVALGEEFAFRGYILNNLMSSMNKWMALLYSALIFALFHFTNPGVNLLSLVNVFLAGLLLGINYIFTKNLWFGIFFHFAWNFYQGSVLGYKVSGMPLKSLFEQQVTGPVIVTGGAFGFEGSVLATILTILALLLLTWVYKKRYTS